MRNAYRILVRKSEGKRPLKKPWRGWKGNIRMDLRETGRESVDWMHLAQGWDKFQDLMYTVMNFGVP
jgi:hypothetical protein